MANSSQFTEQVPVTLRAIDPVIRDLKARPDADEQADAIQTLTNYRTLLQTYTSAPTQVEANKIKTENTPPTLQTVSDQIDANIAMSNMGQLNTQRIISPTTLTEYNERLDILYSSLNCLLVASTEPSVDTVTPFPDSSSASSALTPNFDSYEPAKVSVLPGDPDASPGNDFIIINQLKTGAKP